MMEFIEPLIKNYYMIGIIIAIPVIFIYNHYFRKYWSKAEIILEEKYKKKNITDHNLIYKLKSKRLIRRYIFGMFSSVAAVAVIALSILGIRMIPFMKIFFALINLKIIKFILPYSLHIAVIILISIVMSVVILYSVSMVEKRRYEEEIRRHSYDEDLPLELNNKNYYLTIRNSAKISSTLIIIITLFAAIAAWF